MPVRTDIRLIGLPELRVKLRALPGNVQKRIMRPAVNFALTPMNAKAKRNCPVDTGILKSSIGKKIKQYVNSGTTWGAIGVRKGFAVNVGKAGGTIRIGKKDVFVAESHNPRAYVHLVEFGHVLRRKKKGPTVGYVKGSRFLTRAYEATKDEALRRLAVKIEKGIAKEATRK